MACTMAWRREPTPSLSKTLLTWRLTVIGEIDSASAISLFVRWRARCSSTWASRSVSWPPGPAPDRRPGGGERPGRWRVPRGAAHGRGLGGPARRRAGRRAAAACERRQQAGEVGRGRAARGQAAQQGGQRRAEVEEGAHEAARLGQRERGGEVVERGGHVAARLRRQRLHRQGRDHPARRVLPLGARAERRQQRRRLGEVARPPARQERPGPREARALHEPAGCPSRSGGAASSQRTASSRSPRCSARRAWQALTRGRASSLPVSASSSSRSASSRSDIAARPSAWSVSARPSSDSRWRRSWSERLGRRRRELRARLVQRVQLVGDAAQEIVRPAAQERQVAPLGDLQQARGPPPRGREVARQEVDQGQGVHLPRGGLARAASRVGSPSERSASSRRPSWCRPRPDQIRALPPRKLWSSGRCGSARRAAATAPAPSPR